MIKLITFIVAYEYFLQNHVKCHCYDFHVIDYRQYRADININWYFNMFKVNSSLLLCV